MEKDLKILHRHVWFKKMTFVSTIKVNTQFQVYIKQLIKSDKFKLGKEQYVNKKVTIDKNWDIFFFGRIFVMGMSDPCRMKGVETDDCDFDKGGRLLLIKGAEIIFIAQEKMCKKRLWISITNLFKSLINQSSRGIG